MKTKSFIYIVTALVISCSLSLSSCRKKKENEAPELDKEQNTANDNSLAENMMSDIQEIGGQASENSTLTAYKGSEPMDFMSVCATITPDAANKTFTVDFGSTPCPCKDGRLRSGKLIFNYSASTNNANAYREPGFSCSVTSQNYVVDSYTVNIVNKTVTNTTPAGFTPSTTNLTWTISANVNIVKPSNAGTVTWNCSRTKTLLNTSDPNVYPPSGGLPINWSKAKIQLNGTANGVTAGNENYTCTLNNLVRDMNCSPDNKRHPFISGTMVFTPGSRPTRTIDFGSGTCDFGGTITINGNTYTFTAP